jgi:hypothetical protein
MAERQRAGLEQPFFRERFAKAPVEKRTPGFQLACARKGLGVRMRLKASRDAFQRESLSQRFYKF